MTHEIPGGATGYVFGKKLPDSYLNQKLYAQKTQLLQIISQELPYVIVGYSDEFWTLYTEQKEQFEELWKSHKESVQHKSEVKNDKVM